jgi:gamma-glutamylcyclotransferase (GGCT)/AIG2-like uncharacterized protein YtfP
MERVTYFFYGTLMDAAVLARVSGMVVTAARLRPAVLEGYRRMRVADQHYPALAPAAGARVHGCVFRNAPPEAQRRIAAYEESTYDLRWEWVKGLGGIRTQALVFVAGPKMALSEEEWDYEDWCRRYRRPFLMGLDRWLKDREGRSAADV